MQINKTHKIIIGLGIILLAIGMVFYKKIWDTSSAGNNSTTTPKVTVMKDENGNEYIVEEVPVGVEDIVVPDLNRKVVFGSSISLDAPTRKIVSDRIISIQAELKKDSKQLSKWVDLGLYQKMAGDYEGASLSWKYVGEVSNDYVAVGNLGNLYAYYMKDKLKAEVYYKEAIRRDPSQIYLYVQLAEVYRDVFQNKTKAIATIDEALKISPNNQELITFKASIK